MGPWAEEMYVYSFFNVGTRRGGWSMALPSPIISKKETRYPLCWRLVGPQGRRGLPLFFL